MKVLLTSEVCLLGSLVDETSTLCCLSSSFLCELIDESITGEVCGLVSLSPLRLSIVSLIISSSSRGFSVFLLAPSYSAGPVMGVVSSLSLFLLFSSFRGVCNAGISGALVCTRGIWSCCSDISCCYVLATSLPFEELETGALASCIGCYEVLAKDVPTPSC